MQLRSKIALSILSLVLVSCAGVGKVRKTQLPLGLLPSVRPIVERPYKVLGLGKAKVSTFNFLHVAHVTPTPDFNRALQEIIQEK